MKKVFTSIALMSSLLLSAQEIQWASKVVKAHTGLSEKQFNADQVLGEPNVYPSYGPYATAWASLHPNAKKNDIHVAFDKEQSVQQIAIFETYFPGALEKIFIVNKEGKEVLVKSFEPAPAGEKARIVRVFLDAPQMAQEIKLLFNGKLVDGYNAVDAIAISDSKTPIDFKQKVDPTIDLKIKSKPLPGDINTPFSEVKPLVSPDGMKMYFSRAHHPDNVGGEADPEDIWFADINFEDWSWKSPENLKELNNSGPNYISAISEDDRANTMLVLGNVYSKNEKKVEDGISVTTATNEGGWTHPEQMIIEDYSNIADVEHYYLGLNNTILIMAVERPEGLGGTDLFISKYDKESSKWKKPEHMGDVLNSAAQELSPFMAMDNDKVLYFSTDGRSGYGDQDIYRTTRLDDSWTNWTEPVNMGPGVNSAFTDIFYSLPPGAEYAYFCRNDETGKNLDIYNLYLPAYEVGAVVLVNGNVSFSKEEHTLNEVDVWVKEKTSNSIVAKTKTDTLGNFKVKVDYGKAYSYGAVVEGVDTVWKELDLTDVKAYEEQRVVIMMSESQVQQYRTWKKEKAKEDSVMAVNTLANGIDGTSGDLTTGTNSLAKVGVTTAGVNGVAGNNGTSSSSQVQNSKTTEAVEAKNNTVNDATASANSSNGGVSNENSLIELENGELLATVYFEYDQSEFNLATNKNVDSVVDKLKMNNTLKITVTGYTDSKGTESYNMKLSKARAQSAKDYLVSKGVSSSSVTVVGKGEANPVANNDSEANKAKNRRVEFSLGN